MSNKKGIIRILLKGYLIHTLLLLIAEAVLFIIFGASFNELSGILIGSLILSAVSFAASALTSPDDRNIRPGAAVLYAVMDVIVFSFGAGYLTLRAMAGMQGGSGLAVMMVFIGAGMAIIPFAAVLALVAARMIKRELLPPNGY
jgi:hypothetical protein